MQPPDVAAAQATGTSFNYGEFIDFIDDEIVSRRRFGVAGALFVVGLSCAPAAYVTAALLFPAPKVDALGGIYVSSIEALLGQTAIAWIWVIVCLALVRGMLSQFHNPSDRPLRARNLLLLFAHALAAGMLIVGVVHSLSGVVFRFISYGA